MLIELTPYVLDDFKDITGKDVRGVLYEYAIFYQYDYISIKNFYSGKNKTIDPQSFVNFINIKKEVIEAINTFQNFNKQLENIKFVELLQHLEECNDALNTLNKINKWSRVTTEEFGYNPNFKLQYVLSQYDTLEKIASIVARSTNPQDDWRNVGIENLLTEDSYTIEGGKVLNVTVKNRELQNFQINSVVDVIKGKNILGKDLDRNMHFDVYNQDMAVLSEDETILQAIDVLVTLRKRDNLDFLNHGLQASLIIGQSKSLFNFPVVDRQLKETFANDDTLKNFKLTGFKFDQDNVIIDFTVQNRLNELMELTITI